MRHCKFPTTSTHRRHFQALSRLYAHTIRLYIIYSYFRALPAFIVNRVTRFVFPGEQLFRYSRRAPSLFFFAGGFLSALTSLDGFLLPRGKRCLRRILPVWEPRCLRDGSLARISFLSLSLPPSISVSPVVASPPQESVVFFANDRKGCGWQSEPST